jgi:hypothetical protein
MGPGSAAHRRRGAALRPGHESGIRLCIRIEIARAVFRSRGTSCPSFAAFTALENAEGAGKAGCRPGTHGPLCERWLQKSAQRHTGEAKHPAFPAQWFDGLCRALPGERCTIAPVALPMADAPARLSSTHHCKTWRTDPGRQDHTILPYAGCTGRVHDGFRSRFPALRTCRAGAACVHRSPPRVS